jgi:hypothetical protein
MDREAQEQDCQFRAEVGFILSPSARTGLADLALQVKVVQKVGYDSGVRFPVIRSSRERG